MKDLGVFMSSDLSFSIHCSKLASKASQAVGLIRRAFASKNQAFMVKMFTSRVRPILEYNCELWSPHNLQDIDKIESVQRSFTSKIYGLAEFSYWDRLAICKLEPLELRRMKRDLLLLYKMRNGLVGLNFYDFFRYAPDVGNRGHRAKLYPITVPTERALASFAHRVVNNWNALPISVIESTSVCSFKSNLNSVSNQLIIKLRGRAFINYS